MRSIIFRILFLPLLINPLDGLFIRKFETYQNVAKDFSEFYHSKTIIFVHASPEQRILENIEYSTKIFKSKMYFNKLGIATMLIHINKIPQEYGQKLERLFHPLFIILNDYDDVKTSLTTIFSSELDVSKAKWLIFLQDGVKVEHFFEDIYVPLDCEFWVSQRNELINSQEIIKEVYRVSSGAELRRGESIAWKPNTPTLFPKISLTKRRQNLHGHVLRATVPENLSSKLKVRSSMIEIFEKRCNTTLFINTTVDAAYCEDNGTCYGGLGKLANNDTDMIFIAYPPPSHLVERRFDISQPIKYLKYDLYIRQPKNKFSRMNLLKPLEPVVWLTIFFYIIMMSCFLTVMEYYQQKIDQPNERYHRSFIMLYLINLLTVHGALCNQGIRPARLTSIRIISFTIHSSALIIIAFYSALITSALTSDDLSPPFTNVKGLVEDGSYKLVLVNNSILHTRFKNSNSSEAQQVMKMISHDPTLLVKTFDAGIELLCRKEKLAFIMVNFVPLDFKPPKCSLTRFDTVLSVLRLVNLQRRSPYRMIINAQIIAMWEHGHGKKMVTPFESILKKQYTENHSDVHLAHIMPLILTVLMGMATSILVLFIERFVHHRMIRNPKIFIIPNKFIKNRKYPLRPRSNRPRSIMDRRSTQLTPKFRRIRELILQDAISINQQDTSFTERY